MQSTTTGQVSAAQRARSILAVVHDLWLDAGGADPQLVPRHVVLPGGALLLPAPEVVPPAGEVVTLSTTDVTSVPQPDRVRGHLRLRGTFAPYDGPRAPGIVAHLRGTDPEAPEPVLVRFVPVEVAVADAATPGTTGLRWRDVDVAAYGAAAPEPFVGHEHRWLPHLQQHHPDAVQALAERVLGTLPDSVRVRALGLDRFGVALRLYAGPARWDVRADFAAEVECGCDVREAVTAMLEETRRTR